MRGFIYILLCVSLASAFRNDDCSNANVLDKLCYSIDVHSKLNFKEAKLRCLKNKGILAQISDQKTQNFVRSIIKQSLTSRNISTEAIWIELTTQRVDGSWTGVKSRINRYYYSQLHGSCTRLNVKNVKAEQTPCGHLYFPLCQYQTANCSFGDITSAFTNFGYCSANETIQFNSTIQVKCKDGYLLQGPDKITCQRNGSWSHIPNCVPRCAPPLVNDAILIHNLKHEYNIGDQVLLLCENGYFAGGKYLKSHRTITCEAGGKWRNPITDASLACIAEDRLNCPSDMCQSIQKHVELDEKVELNCTGRDGYGVDIWPHFHWLKDHEKLNENDTNTNQHLNGHLEIASFQIDDAGMYTCVRGLNENHVEKVVVYDLRPKYQCEIDPDHNLPTIIVPEDTSVYLRSKGDATAINVAWFKDGRRVWGDKQKIILPTGDLLIRRTTVFDQGFYTFEIESEIYRDMCIDRTVKLVVSPRSASICGLAEPVHPHPWLTTLWWNQETAPFCYGALINEQWVLTSGFCLTRFFRLKQHNVSVGFENGRIVQVENVIPHPFYSKRLNVNDLGLLKLAVPVVFGSQIRPICVPEVDLDRSDEQCTSSHQIVGNASGFGSLDAVNGEKRIVRTETMASVDEKMCEQNVVFQLPITMFCAKFNGKQSGVFAADVGSPFEVNKDGRTFLYGIYSWGQRMPQIGYLDYFTKVSPYYQWIMQQLA